MALVLKDRVRQTSTTAGTGTITLSGSVAGYQNFSVIGTGNTTYYTIADQSGSNWEVGIGTYTSPNQLSRSTILASSNAGAIVNFGAGTKDVFVTLPAEEAVFLNGQNIYAPNAIASKNIITVDDTAVSGYTAVLGVDANGYAVIGGGSSLFGAIDNAILAPQGLQLGDSNIAVVTINAAPTTNYSLNFPPAAGSNNQLLKTDGAGNLGWMDLGSPPAIGGTTPNTIKGTTVTSTTGAVMQGAGIGTLLGSPATAYISSPDGTSWGLAVKNDSTAFDAGFGFSVGDLGNVALQATDDLGNLVDLMTFTGSTGDSPVFYNLKFPTTTGSNNQVLKTDGSGNLGWLDFGSPPAIGGTTPAAGTFTNIASATAPTNTVPALALTGTPNAAAGAKTGVLGIGPNFTASDKNIMASFVQSINDYTQIVVQNPNAGASASADFIVNNNNTSGSGTYGDFGINSSTFSGTGSFGLANATYLYSQGGDLSIGTAGSNSIHFVINSGATDTATITSTGIGIGVASPTAVLNLKAGTATASTAPLKFTNGVNLTVAEAGAVEYDGTSVFVTGTTASGRGVNLAPQMVRVNTDRAKATNNTTLEAVFDAANDTLALAANTLYYFRGVYVITKSATATAGAVTIGFAFSNAQQDIGYKSIGFTVATGTAQTTIYNTVATAITATATATGATDYVIELEGWFKSNATTGGTLIPQFAQSVVGTTVAPTAKANTWFMIQPMSSTPTATLIAGNWS